MLERIPTILSAQEILDKAFLRANKMEIQDPEKYHRIRKTQEIQMKAIAEITSDTLDFLHRSWPTLDDMDAYEREVIDVVAGVDRLRKELSSVHWAKDKIRDVYRQHRDRMLRLRTAEGILACKRSASGRIASILAEVDSSLTFMRETRDKIRLLPTVHRGYATIVVAGFPNVGKTSLLLKWTDAHAEVAAYAFTTKKANVGHFDVPGTRGQSTKVQVVDTPGLLDRPDEERNDVERQATAALRHAADAVLFMIDPTETSGFTLEQQENLLRQVEQDMVGIPMLVAESKSDLMPEGSGQGRINFSTLTGEGLEKLQAAIVEMLDQEEPDLDMDPLDKWTQA